MELNSEQIIKALEWCSSGRNCIECLENDKNPRLSLEGCMAVQMRNALALITSQEQRIKELTEENERLREETYRLECDLQLNASEKAVEKAIVQTKKATVRKMQERLEAVKYQSRDWSYGRHPWVVEIDDIDQIAKEMVEGGD